MKKITEWENVKVEKAIVNKLRTHKKKTGVSIMAFVKMAILDKLPKTFNHEKDQHGTAPKTNAIPKKKKSP